MNDPSPAAPLRWLAAAVAWWIRLPVALRCCLPPALMLVLWWSSSRQPTGGEASVVKSFLHNGAHILAYGALATAWWTLFVRRVPPPYLGATAWGLSVAYGVVDELHQATVPGRTCSVTDLGSDAVGAWLAILCLCWLHQQHQRARSMIPWAVWCAVLAVSLATFVPV